MVTDADLDRCRRRRGSPRRRLTVDCTIWRTEEGEWQAVVTVPPLNIRASASPGMWAGGLPRFAMRYTTWKRPLIARRMGAGKVPITVVEVPPLSHNAKDLQCKPELPCCFTVIRRNCLFPVTQDRCTPGWGYSRQAAHHITPLACCNHGRPACHSVRNRRFSLLVGGGCSRGRGVHTLHTISTRKETCTAHVVCTRCLHVLHARMSSPGG